MMRDMWVLDLFSKAGGASMGYRMAGWQVVGVDIEPQEHYPFEFVQADAFWFLERYGRLFDLIHGSPECRDHTALTSVAGKRGTGWQLGSFIELCERSGKPYVVENVNTARFPDRYPHNLVLCADRHFKLRTVRHRKFRCSGFEIIQPPHPAGHSAPTSTKKRRRDWDRGMHISVTGDVGTHLGRQAMGIDWMTGKELAQAIPPAYTEWIGWQAMLQLRTI